jgi:hypothetical protein
MAEVPIVGWDVAFTPTGIYLLEVSAAPNCTNALRQRVASPIAHPLGRLAPHIWRSGDVRSSLDLQIWEVNARPFLRAFTRSTSRDAAATATR